MTPVLALWFASLPWVDALGGKITTGADGQVAAINLRASWITDGDLLHVASLPTLRKLDLSQTRISDQGLAYLKAASGLTEVNLAYAEKIGDPAHAVVRTWKKLRVLNLRGTVIADETAASAAGLPDLEALDIADTLVGDVGMESLTLAPKLRELSIGNIRMSEAGFQSLRQFTTLTMLDISGKRHTGASNITANSFEAVASLRQLKVLRLGHTTFPAKSFPLLGAIESLERLGLEFCPAVTDDALADVAAWKSLKWVDLYGTKVTAEGVARLKERRPDLQVLWE